MEDLLLMSGLFATGAGIGALFSYSRDRKLLRLYSELVKDLSSMIPHSGSLPPTDPAATQRVPELAPLTETRDRRAS